MTLVQKRFQSAAYLLLSLVFFLIILTFKQYGISNDEPVQHEYGRLLLEFYRSGFTNRAAFHYVNLYLYGGFFDIIAASLANILPLWVWDIRHLESALFGLAGLLAVYKTTAILSNPRAGFFAILLLTLTAAWTGAMFTHTKDVPFATCMVWALYYTVLVSRNLPAIPLNISIKLGVAIGCALGIRIGGGFSVVYLLLMLLWASVIQYQNTKTLLPFLQKVTMHLMPAVLVSFVLMAVFWPWGVMGFDHALVAIKDFSHFSFNMKTIDNSVIYDIGAVPSTYLFSYLIVRLPEVFLLGLFSFVLYGLANIKSIFLGLVEAKQLGFIVLIIALLFPMSFVFLTEPALYNGIRHFTFLLPPLAIMAGLGIEFAVIYCLRSMRLTVFAFAPILLIGLMTLTTLVKLHPYEYVYYNVLAGERATIVNRWELDYWSASMPVLLKQLNHLPLTERSTPYLVAVCAETLQGSAYLLPKFKVTKDWVAADFYVASTNMHCDQVAQGKVIGEEKRLGMTLAILKDRRMLTGDARLIK
jgi:hypothetical protein